MNLLKGMAKMGYMCKGPTEKGPDAKRPYGTKWVPIELNDW